MPLDVQSSEWEEAMSVPEALWGALKFGPIGLAGIAAFFAGQLFSEMVKEQQISKTKRKLFHSYLIFCAVLLSIAVGAVFLDNAFFKSDRRAAAVRETLGRLDENELQKFNYVSRGVVSSDGELATLIVVMCETMITIAEAVDGNMKHCKNIVAGSKNRS
jgi:hypothetical protein